MIVSLVLSFLNFYKKGKKVINWLLEVRLADFKERI